MGGKRIWQDQHTTYCFNKFTTATASPDKGQDGWYLPCNVNGKLALPRAQRGNGGNIVKLWFEKAQVDNLVLWGTPMNLQNFWTNLPHKAKLFLLSPHNQENSLPPVRTVEYATEQQQQQIEQDKGMQGKRSRLLLS
jgi:hypothetical protein